MRQTKESNKRATGRVVIYISLHLGSINTLTFSNVLLVLALDLTLHKSSYCKCSLAWCQARPFLLFAIWTHPLQMREYPLQYASTDKNKKSHYNISRDLLTQDACYGCLFYCTMKTVVRCDLSKLLLQQSDRNIARCRLFYLFLFMALRHLRSSRTVFIFMHI